VTDPLTQAGTEYQAESYAEAARTAAQVEEFVNATAPTAPPAPAKTKEQLEAEQLAEAAQAALPMIAKVAWGMLDKGIQSFGGTHCAADREELERLAQFSVPVIEKYLGNLGEFVKTPEGVLLAVAALTYAPKFIAGPPKLTAPAAPAPVEAPKPEATA
jgi:hypothetical protein